MTKADVGHSAYDPTVGIVDELSGKSADERVIFLRAAVTHAEEQAELAAKQYERLVDKWDSMQDAWQGKLDEADKIRVNARQTADAYARELEALV